MPINIILDKNVIEGFSRRELILLNKYYRHNVTPMLCLEIIADLSKDGRNGLTAEQAVSGLASKLLPSNITMNVWDQELVRLELLGEKVIMDGQPIVQLDKVVETSAGTKTVLVKETVLEQAVRVWVDGGFIEADVDNARSWRERTTKKDLLAKYQTTYGHIPELNSLKSMDQVNSFVMNWFADPDQQENLLTMLLGKYARDEPDKYTIYNRWCKEGKPDIASFVPYSMYCLRVETVFILGVLNRVLSDKSTNLVDLQYLYFLPFCDVFSSNDKFFDAIIPYFLRDDQEYIKGTALKADLSTMLATIDNMEKEEQIKYYQCPPINELSFTYKLWNRMGYPPTDEDQAEMNEEAKEYIKANAREFEESIFYGQALEEGNIKANMFGRCYSLAKTDPCPICISGNNAINCCLTEYESILEMQRTTLNNTSGRLWIAAIEGF